MQGKRQHVHICPQCGSGLWRVHRHLGDRVVSLFRNVHRYRCQNIDCGWEGTTVRPPTAASTSARRARSARRVLAGTVVALVGLASIRFVAEHQAPPARPQLCDLSTSLRYVPAGESYDGFDLPLDSPVAPSPAAGLTLRSGCAWGVPGRSPYRGSVREALAAARLPEDVVHKIDAMVARRAVSGRVEISRDHIRTVDGRRNFDSKIVAMGFGRTMCFATRVNFTPGHLEYADLYDATDATGRNYAVMVPYVCGNVSVLAERAERPEVASAAAGPFAGSPQSSPVPGVPGTPGGRRASRLDSRPLSGGIPDARNGDGGVWVAPETPGSDGGGKDGNGQCEPPGNGGGTRTVAEPATLALVLAALALLGLGRRLGSADERGRRLR
jgi:predicted RNA-binding Zn-ribbon protein involved in translation (DUF1610 family)